MKCRFCSSEVTHVFADLGSAPPSNAYLTESSLKTYEKWFPLKVLTCSECKLVQTEDFAQFDELFSADYAYFSSFSQQWLQHSRDYVQMSIERFGLNENSLAVEVAANDGYLLQYFQERSVPCLGIEPTHSTAEAARAKGLEIVEEFFGEAVGRRLSNDNQPADLMIANNVQAHVPDINDFVKGFSALLKPTGVCTFEFPSLPNLIQQNQFDTIYHEHFSYLSLTVVSKILEANGLAVFDVENLPTHGGSLRVFAQPTQAGVQPLSKAVQTALDLEANAGILGDAIYSDFQSSAEKVKNDFTAFLLEAKEQGKVVAGYGAAAKGNTLLNFAGVKSDLVSFVVDSNPSKAGKYLPGSRVPIVHEDRLTETRPDYVVIFPWNLREEITKQLDYIRAWGGKFVIAVPHLEID